MSGQSKLITLKGSSSFDPAIRIFKKGGVIAYPTETFYGLCVDPFNEKAINRLFSLKGREKGKPISLIIKDRKMLDSVATNIPNAAEKLIERFWPGPLTIILEANPRLSAPLTGSTGTVGVRVSSSAAATRLVDTLSSPITATSANPSGKPAPTAASQVLNYFDDKIDLLIDGGTLGGRTGSTIIDLTGKEPLIVREGELSSLEVLKYANH